VRPWTTDRSRTPVRRPIEHMRSVTASCGLYTPSERALVARSPSTPPGPLSEGSRLGPRSARVAVSGSFSRRERKARPPGGRCTGIPAQCGRHRPSYRLARPAERTRADSVPTLHTTGACGRHPLSARNTRSAGLKAHDTAGRPRTVSSHRGTYRWV
jgi:hypothetical protein